MNALRFASLRQERAVVNKYRPAFIHSQGLFRVAEVPRGSGFEAGAVQAETEKNKIMKKYYVLLGYPGAPRYNLYVDWRGSPSPGRGSAPAPAHSRPVLQSSAQFKFGILKRANWRCCYITIPIKKGSWSALTESFMKFAIIYAVNK